MPPRRRSIVREESFAHIVNDDGYYLLRMREILDTLPRVKPPANHVRLCDHVFMGSQRNAEDIETLRKDGIAYVLSCVQARRSTESPYDKASGVRGFLLIPAEDREDFDIARFFDSAIQFLQCVREEPGGQALVHCNLGVNRSGAVAAAYLMVAQRRNLLDVVQDLKQRRQSVLTNKGFRKQLIQFARKKGLLDPVVDTVTRITYCDPPDGTVAVRKRRSTNSEVSQGTGEASGEARRADSDYETIDEERNGMQGSVTLPRRKTRESRRTRNETVSDENFSLTSPIGNHIEEAKDNPHEHQTVSTLKSVGVPGQNEFTGAAGVGLSPSGVSSSSETRRTNAENERETSPSVNQKTFVRYQNIQLGLDIPKVVADERAKSTDERKRAVSALHNINLSTSVDTSKPIQSGLQNGGKESKGLKETNFEPERLGKLSEDSSSKNSANFAVTTASQNEEVIEAAKRAGENIGKTVELLQSRHNDRLRQPKKTVNFSDSVTNSESIASNVSVSSAQPVLSNHAGILATSASQQQQLTKSINANKDIIAPGTPSNSLITTTDKTATQSLAKANHVVNSLMQSKLKGIQKQIGDVRPSTAPVSAKTSLGRPIIEPGHVRSIEKPVPTLDNVCTVLRTVKATCVDIPPTEIKLVVKATTQIRSLNTAAKKEASRGVGSENEKPKATLGAGFYRSLNNKEPLKSKGTMLTTGKFKDGPIIPTKPSTEISKTINKLKPIDRPLQLKPFEASIKTLAIPPTLPKKAAPPNNGSYNNSADNRPEVEKKGGQDEIPTMRNVNSNTSVNSERRRITRQREHIDFSEDDVTFDVMENRKTGEQLNNNHRSETKFVADSQKKALSNFQGKNHEEIDNDDSNSVASCFEPYTFNQQRTQGKDFNSGRQSAMSWYDTQVRASLSNKTKADYRAVSGNEDIDRNDWIDHSFTNRLSTGRTSIGGQQRFIRRVNDAQDDEEGYTIGGLTLQPVRGQEVSRRLSSAECYRPRPIETNVNSFIDYSQNSIQNSNRRLSSIETNESAARGTIPNPSKAMERQDSWSRTRDSLEDIKPLMFGESGSPDKGRRFSKLISDIKLSAVNLAMRGSAVMNMALFSAMGSSNNNSNQNDSPLVNSAMKIAAINSAVRSAVNTAIKGSTVKPNRSFSRQLSDNNSSDGSSETGSNQTINPRLFTNRNLAIQQSTSSPQRNELLSNNSRERKDHSPVVINIPVKHDETKTKAEPQNQNKPNEVLDKAVLGDIREQLRKVPRTAKVPLNKPVATGFQLPALKSVSDSKRKNDEPKDGKELQNCAVVRESSEPRRWDDKSSWKAVKTELPNGNRDNKNQLSAKQTLGVNPNVPARESRLTSNNSNSKTQDFISLYVKGQKPDLRSYEIPNEQQTPITVDHINVFSANNQTDNQKLDGMPNEPSPSITVSDYSPSRLNSSQDNGYATVPRISRRNDSSKLMSQKILQQLNTAIQRHAVAPQGATAATPVSGNSDLTVTQRFPRQPNLEWNAAGNGRNTHETDSSEYDRGLTNETPIVFHECKQDSDSNPNDYRTWSLLSSSVALLSVPSPQTTAGVKEPTELFVDCGDDSQPPASSFSYPSSPNVVRTKPPFQRRTDLGSPTVSQSSDRWAHGRDSVIGIAQIDIRPTTNVSFRYRSPDRLQTSSTPPSPDDSSGQFSGFLMHVGTRRAAPLVSRSASNRNLSQQWQFESLPDDLTMGSETPEVAAAAATPTPAEAAPCNRPIRAYTRSRTDSEIVRHRPRVQYSEHYDN